MEILSVNGAQYRTQLMTQAQAERFAKCLAANPAFGNSFVAETTRETKSPERRWYVAYHPHNPARRVELLQRQEDKRAEKAAREGAGYTYWLDPDSRRFWWCLSASGEVYEVDEWSCSCPDHQFRCKHAGIQCKHQIALAAHQQAQEVRPAEELAALLDAARTTEEREARRARVARDAALWG